MATPDDHKNFAYSTVATAPSPASSGTSLVVASGDGTKFPSVSFNATVWPAGAQPTSTNAEIVRVTAISTDTFTITRTQEGTSARTVVVGDQIAATITDKSLTDIETLTVGGDLTGTLPNPTFADATITALKGAGTANTLPWFTATDTLANAAFIGAAWTAFTPTLSNGWALGDATYTANYARVGRKITYWVSITIGSTTTIGTGMHMDLPVAAVDADAVLAGWTVGVLQDVGTASYSSCPRPAGTTTTKVDIGAVFTSGSYATATQVTSTVPFTWTTGDKILVGGCYEASS